MSRWAMYIDGYNFYYAIKKQPHVTPLHLGWCDFGRLGDALIGDRGTLQSIYYFTAPVGALGAAVGELGSEAARQDVWLKAVRSIPRLTVVHGFHSVDGPRDQREKTKKRTEKQTDVNIAVSLVRDAALDRYDTAIVVTADSDQIPAVRSATKDFGRNVEVWLPPGSAAGRWAECTPIKRIRIASLTSAMLSDARLPDQLRVGATTLEIPTNWRAPK